MRPAQLRVFDGLRLTTEHLEHLQESWRSSVQDLREILGLGVVYRGCEVTAAGDSAVTVQPGLAFDLQKNRLVFDEPKTVQVVFAPDLETQFVCLQYDQIEGGKIADHFTLLWDSCSVVLRTAMPVPPENLVVLARLDKTENGLFTIADLLRPAVAEATEPEAGENSTPDGTTPSTVSSHGATPQSGEPESSAPAAEPETPPPALLDVSLATPPAEDAPAAVPLLPPWPIRQGVAHLAGEPSPGTDLGALLIGPLRNQLAAANGANAEVRFTLLSTDIALDFPVLSLSCHTGISTVLTFVAPTADPSAETPPPPALQAQTTAQGEATFAVDGIAQFGVCTRQLLAGGPDLHRGMAALTERGVAYVVLGGFGVKSLVPGPLEEALTHLQLLFRVEQGATAGWQLVCNLVWSGGISEDSITALDIHKPTVIWNGFLAWKALGAPERTAI